MIKKIITIFITFFLLLTKKIFIRENRVPHKIMDNLSNKLHSLFLFTSFLSVYITANKIIYGLLFLQLVIIIRYFNKEMLVTKSIQVNIIKIINKLFIFIFILNWIFISFGTAFFSLVILLLNNGLYIIIINLINKNKEQDEFKKQFGEEGNYTKADILKTHIINLFEVEKDIKSITKQDIKRQYRAMAKKYHPDVYKGEKQEKFSSIHLSYKYLMNIKNS